MQPLSSHRVKLAGRKSSMTSPAMTSVGSNPLVHGDTKICVAKIGAAHGVRGVVKLWPFTEDPLSLLRYGPLSTKDGARQFEVTRAREVKGHLVAVLKAWPAAMTPERLNGLELSYRARQAARDRRRRILPCRPDRAGRGNHRGRADRPRGRHP